MKKKQINTKQRLGDLFRRFDLESIQLGPAWAKAEISFDTSDRDAAWELYVEMLTRVVTQPLLSESGDEQTALESVHSLFGTTREILRQHGRKAVQFSKVAIPVLNQVVRPFTAKWHRESQDRGFGDSEKREQFREELEQLRASLLNYNRMLAEIAGVEDLTALEVPE